MLLDASEGCAARPSWVCTDHVGSHSDPAFMSVETLPLSPERRPRETPGRSPRRLARIDPRSLELTRGLAFGIVGALIVVSLLLRLRTLHTHLWVDEGLSVGIASHPLAHIPSLLRQDGSPPLYYLLLHIWMAWRGHSEAATHELSLIFALLTIPAAYWAGSSLFDRRTGLICAVLAALTPYLSAYAEETRMYALVALLAVILAASFLHAFVYHRRRYRPIFAIALAAVLYTHNWGLFLGLATAVAFAVCAWREPAGERRLLIRDGALAFGGAALLFLPWLPTLLYQTRHTGAPWDLPPVFWSLTQGLYSLVGGRGAAVAILLAGGSGLLAIRQLGLQQRRLHLAALSLLVLGLGTLLIGWAYSKISPAWAPRYLAVVIGPMLLVAGLGLARAGRLGLVALVLLAGFWTLDPIASSRNAKSNVEAATAHLRKQIDSGSLVISTQPEQVPTIAYYLPHATHFATPLGPTPDPRVVDWRNALAKLRRASVGGTLMPLLSTVPSGERVLLVVPLNLAQQPLWMKLINRDSTRWTRALKHDPALHYVRWSTNGAGSAGVAVETLLFVKR